MFSLGKVEKVDKAIYNCDKNKYDNTAKRSIRQALVLENNYFGCLM
jgi:hypothetical protein